MAFYRIYCGNTEGDALVVYAPLSDQLLFDPSQPVPHLVRARLGTNQSLWYGEIDHEGTISWSQLSYSSASTLFRRPLAVGRPLRVESFYDEGEAADLVIRDLTRL